NNELEHSVRSMQRKIDILESRPSNDHHHSHIFSERPNSTPVKQVETSRQPLQLAPSVRLIEGIQEQVTNFIMKKVANQISHLERLDDVTFNNANVTYNPKTHVDAATSHPLWSVTATTSETAPHMTQAASVYQPVATSNVQTVPPRTSMRGPTLSHKTTKPQVQNSTDVMPSVRQTGVLRPAMGGPPLNMKTIESPGLNLRNEIRRDVMSPGYLRTVPPPPLMVGQPLFIEEPNQQQQPRGIVIRGENTLKSTDQHFLRQGWPQTQMM
ncbi:MAG: hypothetical protein AB2693_32130, partial [Candidatus Thiodiazotropha sp.]